MSKYTGLHGRSPDYQNEHGAITGEDHFVPEGWDELDRGICPRCGRTVLWNPATEKWEADESLVVLVLLDGEVKAIDNALDWLSMRAEPARNAEFARDQVQRQYELNRDEG